MSSVIFSDHQSQTQRSLYILIMYKREKHQILKAAKAARVYVTNLVICVRIYLRGAQIFESECTIHTGSTQITHAPDM